MLYIDGNWLFNAKFATRFTLANIIAPPGAPCLAQRIPSRSRPQLALPKTEESTPGHLPRWKNLFHLGDTILIGGIVEHPDTGKFGNGFFEQLQPLPA